jgi:hypothetical protein
MEVSFLQRKCQTQKKADAEQERLLKKQKWDSAQTHFQDTYLVCGIKNNTITEIHYRQIKEASTTLVNSILNVDVI